MSFVIYDHVAYVGESVPESVVLTLGDQLGEAEIDTAGENDPCKRERSPAAAVRIDRIDPRVAVAVAARPGVAFVVAAACSGYEGAERWRCLLEPLTFDGESYTGVRHPGAEPERGVPFGDPLGGGVLAGAAVTAVSIEGVDRRSPSASRTGQVRPSSPRACARTALRGRRRAQRPPTLPEGRRSGCFSIRRGTGRRCHSARRPGGRPRADVGDGFPRAITVTCD